MHRDKTTEFLCGTWIHGDGQPELKTSVEIYPEMRNQPLLYRCVLYFE
jgi:hypothetical protein